MTSSNGSVAEKVTHNELSQMRVLVVDDDPLLCSVISKGLHRLGVKSVNTAQDGVVALNMLATGSGDTFDMIVCDLLMPEMDGVVLLRHIAQCGYRGKIILISGEDCRILKTVESLAQAHHLNVLGVLQKPFNMNDLKAIITGQSKAPNLSIEKQSYQVDHGQLFDGIVNGELQLYYQPKVSTYDKTVIGVEALVRWRHSQFGMIPPERFVPMAEENALIDLLTDAVVQMAFKQQASWQSQGIERKLSINVSMDNLLNVDFVENILNYVERFNIEPDSIIFELTESRVMKSLVTSLEILTRLSLLGFHLSIDDFGTGYSTLEQLKRIPFSELKIDRSFVRGASDDPASRAILESNVLLGKKLNMQIVAEGVETVEDWLLVSELGCDLVQGYYVAKPMPASQVQWIWQQ